MLDLVLRCNLCRFGAILQYLQAESRRHNQLSNRHSCLPSQHTRTTTVAITSTHLLSNHPKRRPRLRGLLREKACFLHSCAAAWETLNVPRVSIMKLRPLLAVALMGQQHLAGVLAATDDVKVDLRPCLITKAAIVSAYLFVWFALAPLYCRF